MTRTLPVAFVLLLVLSLTACATEPIPAAPRPSDAGDARLTRVSPSAALPPPPIASAGRAEELQVPSADEAGDAPLWSVDGNIIRKSDLGDFVLRYQPDRARSALDQLLDEAVIRAEAARESVTLPEALVRERCDRHIEERRREARIQYGAATDFEALVRERFGRDLAAFRADAERLVRSGLLRDRLVRLGEFRDDAADVRVLVFGTREAALGAAASLRAGADMTLLAERAGIRRPAAPPPVRRGETGDASLEERLFGAAPGEVLEPVSFDAPAGGTFWQVFKVVRTWKASDAPYDALSARIEESLESSPVTEEEFARWRRRAFARHEIVPAGTGKGSIRAAGGE